MQHRTPHVRRARWVALAALVCFLAFQAQPALAAEGSVQAPGAAPALPRDGTSKIDSAAIPAAPQPGALRPPAVAPDLDVTGARQAALERMAQQVAAGHAPEWQAAVLAEPILFYDLSGAISAYLFSVRQADGGPAGYLTIASAALPNPVLEFSTTGLDPLAEGPTRLAARGYQPLDASRPLYLGLLSYAYEIEPQAVAPGAVQGYSGGGRAVFDVKSGALVAAPAGQDGPLWAQALPGTTLSEAAGADANAPAAYNLIGGVPDWNQFQANFEYPGCWSGCTPTSAMTVLGYWSSHGFANLISGGNWQAAVAEIRSYMGGRCSAAGGTTWTNIGTIASAVRTYAANHGYTINSDLWGNGWPVAPTYANYRAQIDAGRPILVDLIGHATYGDHTVAGVGYDSNGSYMIIHDNWPTTGQDVAVQYGAGYREIYMNPVVPASRPGSKRVYLPWLRR